MQWKDVKSVAKKTLENVTGAVLWEAVEEDTVTPVVNSEDTQSAVSQISQQNLPTGIGSIKTSILQNAWALNQPTQTQQQIATIDATSKSNTLDPIVNSKAKKELWSTSTWDKIKNAGSYVLKTIYWTPFTYSVGSLIDEKVNTSQNAIDASLNRQAINQENATEANVKSLSSLWDWLDSAFDVTQDDIIASREAKKTEGWLFDKTVALIKQAYANYDVRDKNWAIIQLWEWQEDKLWEFYSGWKQVNEMFKEGMISEEQYNQAIEAMADETAWLFTIDQVARAEQSDAFRLNWSLTTEYLRKYFETIDRQQDDAETFSRIMWDMNDVNKAEEQLWEAVWYVLNKYIWPTLQNSNLNLVARNEFNNDAYRTASSQIGRWVDAMSRIRQVKTKLIDINWEYSDSWSDEDKEIWRNIQMWEAVFMKALDNLWNLYVGLAWEVNPDTWRLESVPDIIKGQTLHNILHEGLDEIIDSGARPDILWWHFIPESSTSIVDILNEINSDVWTLYSLWHEWWWKQLYVSGNKWLSVVWDVLNELGQQVFGRTAVTLYNIAASDSWEANFSAVNEDFSTLATMTTNKSWAGRLIQEYMTNALEYTPEVAANWLSIDKLTKLPRMLSKASVVRKFFNNNLWKVPKALWGTTTEQLIQNLWTSTPVGNKSAKFWQYIITDAVPDVAVDSAINWIVSKVDNEYGSDISMAFDVWGTAIWVGLGKLIEMWLINIGRNGLNRALNSFRSADNQVQVWWLDWTVWDLFDNVDSDLLNKVVKANYWIDNAWLLTWDEFRGFADNYRTVSNTLKASFDTLTTGSQVELTQLMKQKILSNINPLLEQFYMWGSQFANKLRQIVQSSKTNPADLFKYVLWVDGKVKIWPWVSVIWLQDSASKAVVRWYDINYDTILADWGFWTRLRNWFTEYDLSRLESAWQSWASRINRDAYFDRVGDKYYFNEEWFRASWVSDEVAPIELVSRITKSSEDFAKNAKASWVKKISDELIDEVVETWAYDMVADALWNLEWLCWLKI